MKPIGAPFQKLVPEIAAIAADRRGFAPILLLRRATGATVADRVDSGAGGVATPRGPAPKSKPSMHRRLAQGSGSCRERRQDRPGLENR
jgi:hypothetical protein